MDFLFRRLCRQDGSILRNKYRVASTKVLWLLRREKCKSLRIVALYITVDKNTTDEVTLIRTLRCALDKELISTFYNKERLNSILILFNLNILGLL